MVQPTRTSPVIGTQAPPSGAVPHAAPATPPQAQLPIGQNPPLQTPQMNPFPQLQQTFALMNQQIAAQMAALGANPMMQNAAPDQPQGQSPQPQPQPHQPPQPQHQPHQLHQPHTQHHPHHHPHSYFHPPRLPQGSQMQGNPNLTPQHALHQHMAQQSLFRQQNQMRAVADQQAMNAATPRSNSAPPPGLGNTNTVIRETFGPNGERHQSIVSSGTIQINRGAQVSDPDHRRGGSSRAGASRSGTPNGHAYPPNRGGNSDIIFDASLLNLRLQLIQAHMLSMELAMNLGTVPPDSVQEQIRALLQSVAPMMNHQQYQGLESRRQTLSDRAATMRRNLDAQLHRAAEQVASQRAVQNSDESAIYLLSSSNGPQALLVSPSGYYVAHWPPASAPATQPVGLPDPPILNAAQNVVANAQQAHINIVQPAQVQPNGPQQVRAGEVLPFAPVLANPPGPAIPQRQQQERAHQHAQAQNPARDIVRILIPLGGHLWLLIRLFGFVYFFTHGASWHRTILLSLVAILLFVAQTGLFQPLLQNLWGPIRRHAEALLPLAGNEPPRRGNAPATADGGAADTQGTNREPTPQEAAERLLREREAQDGNFMRQGFRRVERAVALFVASLVPGVGERHIAAREAAEAARQQQDREREERTRGEEEERQQVQGVEATDPASGNPAPSSTGEPPSEAPTTPEQAAQPPLIEV